MFIPVFGNGDVDSPEKAKLMRDTFGLDGAMIGRATIGNPWFFNKVKMFLEKGEIIKDPSIIERVEVARRHLEMSILWKGEILGVLETRRHYGNYFRAIPDFKKFRTGLVTANSSSEVFSLLNLIEQNVRFKKEFIFD